MSIEMIISNLEKIITQRYTLSPDETVEAMNQCDTLGEKLTLLEDFPEKEFFIQILQHYRLFLNNEFSYQSKRYEKALKSYQKLQISISQTQTQFPDLYSQWRYNIDRLLQRIDARIQEIRSLLALAENDIAQSDILFVETINRYSSELQLEQERSDYEHYFDSLGNIFRISGELYRLRGKKSNNRHDFYEAIKNLKKAKFLGQFGLDAVLEEIRDEIITFTSERLENQAESLFTQGLAYSEAEQFDKAKTCYQKSAQIYRSLKQIRQGIEYELQEQIQFSSYYEATAKSLMAKDQNEKAGEQFAHATTTLQNVLHKLQSDSLVQNFEPQIMYFQAMQLFCLAVIEYDKLLPEAIEHFNEAEQKIKISKAKAEELNNIPLVKNCEEALNKLNSYQEIVGLMFQQEKNNF